MPIPALLSVVNPPDAPPVIPVFSRWNRSVITWTPATQNPVLLTGDISGYHAGVVVQPGIKGFDNPPFDLDLDELPALDGSSFRFVRATTRELMLPLFLWAPNRELLLEVKRNILKAFNPKKGPGILQVTEGDGSSRSIGCFYSSGLEGDEGDGAGFTYCKFGLILKAPVPFWYGDQITIPFDISEPVHVNFYNLDGTHGFMNPGLHISTSQFDPTGAIISTSGDVDSWPVWKVTCTKTSQFLLNNLTTGDSLVLNHDFGATGDTVTIDTNPGVKTVVSARDGNVWSELGPSPKLWPIPDGDSEVQIKLLRGDTYPPGADRAVGHVELSYRPQYLGA